MEKSPAFQFYPADFILGVRRFNAEEIGAYMLLLCEQWDTGFIENSENFWKEITKISPKKLSRVMRKFKICEDGNLRNERLEIERQKQIYRKEKLSESGKKGNEKRWGKTEEKTSGGDSEAIEKTSGGNRLSSSSSSSSSINSNELKKNNKKENLESENYPFQAFWDVYDKKIGKPECESIWKKIPESELEKLMEHLPRYVEATEKQYRLHPERYLKRKHWHNEVIQPEVKTNQTPVKNHREFKTEFSPV